MGVDEKEAVGVESDRLKVVGGARAKVLSE